MVKQCPEVEVQRGMIELHLCILMVKVCSLHQKGHMQLLLLISMSCCQPILVFVTRLCTRISIKGLTDGLVLLGYE